MHALTKIKTLAALGIGNVAHVAAYRLQLRLGIHPVQRISTTAPTGPFFRIPENPQYTDLPYNRQWDEQHCLFGWHKTPAHEAPDWFTNPFNQKRFPTTNASWWMLPDFNPAFGDIKTIWEASRFDWVLCFAQKAAQGDSAALVKLNNWLSDWSAKNPPYSGPNWKCGQEASIRVMHLAMAARLLGQVSNPEPALLQLVAAHLQRIAPTISYALAQNNNHGTSEAAALFIGGTWLHASGDKRAAKWMRTGRKFLEERACKLIEPDGSFSQQSLNYHRVMLDTYCMAEVWRKPLQVSAFSPALRARLAKATDWLYAMVDPESGDAPNLGANDGARLFPLTDTDYRDYRPTVQLAMALFQNRQAYRDNGSYNIPLRWLKIPLPATHAEPRSSTSFPDGGYCTLHANQAFVLFRYPRFRFRPSQADALHVDFWLNNQNILRDGGSFSYADDEAMQYFKGTASHNTIQFDERDQMPRLGRFLFGEWLQAEDVCHMTKVGETITTSASYRDWKGAKHHRKLTLSTRSLQIEDHISDFEEKAILRWRLAPGEWSIAGNTISNNVITLTVTSDAAIQRFELTDGRESRYYLQQTTLPVLEIEVTYPGTLTTMIAW